VTESETDGQTDRHDSQDDVVHRLQRGGVSGTNNDGTNKQARARHGASETEARRQTEIEDKEEMEQREDGRVCLDYGERQNKRGLTHSGATAACFDR
jgi:hypothetical protein